MAASDHSVYFGGKNTWDDWHLVPSSRPVILPPDAKTKYIDVPGSDGSVDMTQYLTGETPFYNRKGSIEFYVMNGYGEWHHRYSEILNYLHGQTTEIILADDPAWYYSGRCMVNTWKSQKDRSMITIDYEVAPYKLSIQSSKDPWLWNPFDFVCGVIRDYGNMRVDGELQITIHPERKTTIPTFIVYPDDPDSYIQLFWVTPEGVREYILSKDANKIGDIKISSKYESTLIFKGKGIVTIDYRGGSL